MNENTMERPVRNQVYTLEHILKRLILSDEPFLRFYHDGGMCVIQDGPLTDDELLAIEELAQTKWAYQRTTDESSPLFLYAGERPITDLVVIEPNKRDSIGDDPYWVCFKASYREQQ